MLPSVLAFALSGLYTIVDGFFIGQSLGDLGLAAITLAYPAAALLQAVGTGIGLAGAIRCTILQARGEEQTPRTCFSGTVLLLLVTSAVFTAVLLGLLGPVLTVLGAQDETRPLAAEYIRAIAYGTAFQILATGLVPFIRNLGGSAFAMAAMGTGFVTNIALDYLFVWEFHWGMAGGAWATVIGQAATMLLAIGCLVWRRVGFVPPKAGEVLPLWGALLKVAAPIGLTFSPNITLMVMNHFLLRYGGALAIAVYGCIDYVLSTIYMLLQGVGDGSQPLISRAYGAGDFGELRRTSTRSYRAAFVITAACIVALYLARSVIGVLFGASAEANAGVTARLPLFLATLPLLAYVRVTIAYFYATEKTALSYVLVFSEPVLTFVVLLILPQLLELNGVWLAIPAAQALTFCIAVPARRRTQRARELPA